MLAVVLGACGGENGSGPAGEGRSGQSTGRNAAGDNRVSVSKAAFPADHCGWLSVDEVEVVVGPLTRAPQPGGEGCRYTLAIPAGVTASRQAEIDRIEELRKAFNDPMIGEYPGPTGNYYRDPDSYAVTLSVDVSGAIAGEMAFASLGGAQLNAQLDAQQASGQDATGSPGDAGWDAVLFAPYGFSGRIGHVQVSVLGEAPDVPHAVAKALAERVRDRIPDLPFEADSSYQVPQLGKAPMGPCELLPREAAEAVLGGLVVEPYPSSSQHPPLALERGHGCSYYTGDHRVFSIIPTWSHGRQDFNMHKGVGGLMSQVLPQEMVVLKGPWDDAHVSGATGALLFLKGDRLLEVHYKTSSTDMKGAVKLAAQAVQQM